MKISEYYKHLDCDLYYEVIGEGFPIIHLHGYELNHLSLKNPMEEIYHNLKNLKRIYLDLPGMGKSKLNNKNINAENMITIIKDFIQHIIPDQKYALVGLSYGAYLARYLINEINDNSISALLFCPVIKPEINQRKLPAFRVAHKDKSFTDKLEKDKYAEIKDWLVIQNQRVYDYLQKDIFVSFEEGQKDFLEHYQKNSYAFKKDIDKVKKTVDKHCVFICGKEDVIVGYEDCLALSSNYSNADFHLISGAGHFLNREQEAKFNRLAKGWLKDILI
jgi:pimeloyl-ACP methyl ester carboxylesterase